MSDIAIGLWSFPVLLLLIFIRIPIAFAMLLVGFAGNWIVNSSTASVMSLLKHMPYGWFSDYSFSIVPLFLLMGQFATLGGMSAALFKATETWIGHRKGGVAMAAIGACAGFGAICGSSLATAATMGQTALPELRKYGYSDSLSTGTLAAGGTLGILIPPSVILVIYAISSSMRFSPSRISPSFLPLPSCPEFLPPSDTSSPSASMYGSIPNPLACAKGCPMATAAALCCQSGRFS